MNKSRFILASVVLLALTGCSNVRAGENSYDVDDSVAECGAFSLINPTNGATLDEVPTFSWEASNNAKYYTLEVASSPTFIMNNDAYVYYKTDYLSTTSFVISAELSQKNVTYYWKVTAHSGGFKPVCNETFTFFLN